MSKEILEGNKLILESPFGTEKQKVWLQKWKERHEAFKDEFENFPYDKLEYHSSWGWIMPVVEQIENLANQTTGHITFNIHGNGAEVTQSDYIKIVQSFDRSKTKIENVWYCVIQFIQWYNTTLKPKTNE